MKVGIVPVTPFQQNCSLLVCEDTNRAAVVDPGGDLERILHQRLDPALFQQFLITKVPATREDPIAVLSVKTQPDGDVVVYFEP